MAIKTQGTQLYFIDPEATGGPEVLVVECATSIDGISAAREQIDITCLEDQARAYTAGLATPGTMTLSINADGANESHIRLHELYTSGVKFDVAIGWSDGTSAPDIDSAGDFDLPVDRSFLVMLDTYIADFPFSFAQNTVVTSSLTLQLSGFPTWFPKA